jgi:UDP-N-acetylglucosamine 2-epimerase (non-hydrolysing)
MMQGSQQKRTMKVFLVAGARPNFMKIAPLWSELQKHPHMFQAVFIHTGQHYDDEMSRIFLRELGLPDPDIYLDAGSGTHAEQTAKVMTAFEKVVINDRPDLVIVVGDVNSTLACALVASKAWIPVAHVEAGLRSYDRTMPEEINRILTDQISEYLFTTCRDADENLVREGIPRKKIHFVGNIMIESLLRYRARFEASQILERLGLEKKAYALITLHRPSNVDERITFQNILKELDRIQKEIKVVFPAHPRTKRRIKEFDLEDLNHRLMVIDPMGYFDFLALEKNARFVLTDSGGVQEETTFFGVPCLTIRPNTERPITIDEGTNTLVGTDAETIVSESLNILNGNGKRGKIPKYWDGGVSERIVKVLSQLFTLH